MSKGKSCMHLRKEGTKEEGGTGGVPKVRSKMMKEARKEENGSEHKSYMDWKDKKDQEAVQVGIYSKKEKKDRKKMLPAKNTNRG